MALEMNDLMMLRGMDSKEGLSPYEQYKVGYMQQKSHTSGIGVAGLVLGTVGTAVGVGAWLFGGMYGNAKANQAKEVALAAKEIAALLGKPLSPSDKDIISACYKMALKNLKDKDGIYDIRKYFLW